MSYSNIEQRIPLFSNVSSKIKEFPEIHNEIEEKFFNYKAMSENDIPESTWKAAEIGGKKSYCKDVIWVYLSAKLSLSFEIILCILVVPHSNTGEEEYFL